MLRQAISVSCLEIQQNKGYAAGEDGPLSWHNHPAKLTVSYF